MWYLNKNRQIRLGIDEKNCKAVRVWCNKRMLSISVDITGIPEMNSHICSPLINEKDKAAMQWERMVFSVNGAGLIGYSYRKKKCSPLSRVYKEQWGMKLNMEAKTTTVTHTQKIMNQKRSTSKSHCIQIKKYKEVKMLTRVEDVCNISN